MPKLLFVKHRARNVLRPKLLVNAMPADALQEKFGGLAQCLLQGIEAGVVVCLQVSEQINSNIAIAVYFVLAAFAKAHMHWQGFKQRVALGVLLVFS